MVKGEKEKETDKAKKKETLIYCNTIVKWELCKLNEFFNISNSINILVKETNIAIAFLKEKMEHIINAAGSLFVICLIYICVFFNEKKKNDRQKRISISPKINPNVSLMNLPAYASVDSERLKAIENYRRRELLRKLIATQSTRLVKPQEVEEEFH